MLLVLGEEQKEHLSFFKELSVEAMEGFCSAASECILNGVNPRVFPALAEKWEVEITVARRGLESLMNLLSESSKLMINDIDFQDSVLLLDLPEESFKILLQHYLARRAEIRKILSELALVEPRYKDFQWRLDIQIGGRALKSHVVPKLLCKVDIEQSNKEVCPELFEMDVPTLRHVTQALDQALMEIKTAHCRRIIRNIK